MHIRDFHPDDYQAIVDIQNALFPDHVAVIEDYIEGDANVANDAKGLLRRWVAEEDGRVVGVAQYEQSSWDYEPGKYFVMLRVLPAYQRRGLGTALYEHLLAQLAPLQPRKLAAGSREDLPQGVRFLEQRGFVEFIHANRSQLDLPTFDPAPFAGHEAKLRAEGIVLKSVPELGDDPNRDRKLYDLDCTVSPDVPGFNGEMPDFEDWRRYVLDAPMLYRETYFIAVQDGQYIGLTNIWKDRASELLHTGLTGVRREYRRRGVATALKVRSICTAKGAGHPALRTDNEENNPMYQINVMLGFRPLPAWLGFEKVLNGAAADV